MSVVEQLAMRARISDPKPYCCCVCMRGADAETRFIDFQASHDGIVVDPVSGGVIARLKKVEICESCLQEGCEVAALVPSLHQRHLEAVREQMRRAEAAEEREGALKRYLIPEQVRQMAVELEELRASRTEILAVADSLEAMGDDLRSARLRVAIKHDQSLVAQEA